MPNRQDPAHYRRAQEALENSRWRRDTEYAPAVAAFPKTKPGGCPHCTSDEIVCLGRLDALGRFHSIHDIADFPAVSSM